MKMQRAFVIRPFGPKKDAAGREIDFERVHQELIAPALQDAGLGGGTTGEIIDSGNIREDMFGLIIEADIVVCDITVHNANVFYELGIRHALRKKRSVLIKGGPVTDSTPFDILTDRYLAYEVSNPAEKREELADVIRASLAADRETDSPVFKMLPALPEVDPAAIQVVPKDLAEEVARAKAAKAAGWLRLLASEVEGQRFQWPALRLIGQAQWDVADYDGARHTWRGICNNDPNDVTANFALANLYERQFRREKRPELLEDSNQAISSVLANRRTSAQQRAEAWALRGRNAKTLWRMDFEESLDVAQRRERATSRTLLKAYEAYRTAYLFDLNHYWSGLAALQTATIAHELSGEAAWEDAFDDSDRAKVYASELERQVASLRSTVRLAIDAALEHVPRDHKDRIWVEISRADLMFLVEDRAQRITSAYVDAVPKNNFFAWDAAKGQLQLFASLGIREEIAQRVIKTLDAQIKPPAAAPGLQVVIFAGHRIDEPGRAVRRFPADREPRAQERIRDALRELQQDGSRLMVLASAAPGSDIICHEVCQELAIDSTICLPMPKDDFARLAFNDLDGWRSRYLKLVGQRAVLQLSDQEGLPRWLRARKLDPWERGNKWVLEMAQSSAAKTVSLLHLWDGKPEGDALGGTAHMVRLARDAGTIDVIPVKFDFDQ
jgi:hypothetical protein